MNENNAAEIHVQEIAAPLPCELDVEIVERKGLGHPDTICDLVMERISQRLSQAYLRHCGRILHHNCDKGLLVAGEVERRYGGGRVVAPMRLVIGDRATAVEQFDVRQLAVEASKEWFGENLPEIDSARHLEYQVELKGGSDQLTAIFAGEPVPPKANDTSAAVGYAPLTQTERMVLDAERFLNGSRFREAHPQWGRDVKVMGIRTGDGLNFTVAMPLLDRCIDGEPAYFKLKEIARRELLAHLRSQCREPRHIEVSLNTLDREGAGLSGIYLSVLGTSAEDADSGEVGRGNQVNGVIALNRPRGSEAAAGKNPFSHVGKIYTVLTHVVAEQIYQEVAGVREARVWLCSRIGDPVGRPQLAAVQVALESNRRLSAVGDPIRRIVQRELRRMPEFCDALVRGVYSIC